MSSSNPFSGDSDSITIVDLPSFIVPLVWSKGLSILFYPRLQPLLLLAHPCPLVGGVVIRQKIIPESTKSAVHYGASYFAHQPADKAQVVDGRQPQSQELPTLKQMVQVSRRKVTACIAVAIRVKRRLHPPESGIADIAPTLPGK